MANQRVEYLGATCTEQYLTITFTVGQRAARRVHEVKVPVGDLIDTHVREAMDLEVARRLKSLWDRAQGMLPPWE